MKIYHNIPDNKNLFKNPVVTIGNFDGIHIGHQKIFSKLLEVSREKSSDAVVITFSSHPRKILNPKIPIKIITTTEEKTNAIYNLGITNIILLNFTKKMARMHAVDFYNEILINKLDVKEIVIGYDHAFGKNREGNYNFLIEVASKTGIGITKVDEEDMFSRPVSSTWIREEIESGNISRANTLLDRKYTLSGKVIEGKKRGRELGFPTANILPVNNDKVIPCNGVYAVSVIISKNEKKSGMLNIGRNPTFSDEKRSIEVNIFDFNKDIYNTEITIEFHERIRDEIKFPSKDELIKQIKKDMISIQKILGYHNDK